VASKEGGSLKDYLLSCQLFSTTVINLSEGLQRVGDKLVSLSKTQGETRRMIKQLQLGDVGKEGVARRWRRGLGTVLQHFA